jgi:peptidoglycan/LPS O-acetylase OafA/YrhL
LERSGLRVSNVLVSLGESSYSLYLVHIFIVAGFAAAWAYCSRTTIEPFYVLGLISLAAALAISHLVHLGIERPLNSLLKAVISGTAIKRLRDEKNFSKQQVTLTQRLAAFGANDKDARAKNV